MTRKERIKQHFQQYKSYYIFFGTAVTVAGITTLIMRPNPTNNQDEDVFTTDSSFEDVFTTDKQVVGSFVRINHGCSLAGDLSLTREGVRSAS